MKYIIILLFLAVTAAHALDTSLSIRSRLTVYNITLSTTIRTEPEYM